MKNHIRCIVSSSRHFLPHTAVVILSSFQSKQKKKFCDVTVQFVGLKTSEISVTRRKLVQCGD